MAQGWFRDTSDNKLVAAADSEMMVPTDHDFVLKSVIEAVYSDTIWQGGTWDGVTYTPPSNILIPYDSTTDAGMVKDAANIMLDVFDQALSFIETNRHVWSVDTIEKGIEGIHWMIINSARLALNSTRTHARRQKFCEEVASWPDSTNGNVAGYLDAIAADDGLTLPTKDWSWVNTESDPYTRVEVGDAVTVFGNATNVENAPVSSDLIGREWIDDIP